MTIATMPERAAGRKLGDVRAVAEKLDCSPRHVYRMADAGRMRAPLRLASLVRWDLEKIDRGWPWRSWKKVRSTRGWRRKTLTGKLSAALPPYLRRCRLPGLRPGRRSTRATCRRRLPWRRPKCRRHRPPIYKRRRRSYGDRRRRRKPNPPGLPRLRPVSRLG